MASYDPQGNANWAQQPPTPPKAGMSTGTKVVLIVVAVLGGLALLCCGGLMIGGFYLQKSIAKMVSQDPAVVREVTKKLVEIDIPEPLKPEMSMDMDLKVMHMTSVAYADKASQSTLMLMSVKGPEGGEVNQEQMQQQMEQSLREQGVNPEADEQGNWESQASDKMVKIGDQDVKFQIVKKTNKDDGAMRIEVTGTIPREEAPVMLHLNADTKVVSEEQAVKMLESIK